jgi:7,8-dihydropterin-6-yl-methyl-4-(beta-D-ribofuranosyl)aminobenzene 5'-phosphate synthase
MQNPIPPQSTDHPSSISIHLLVENHAYRNDLGAEHGLSFYIQDGGEQVLFDTGQSGLFAANAAAMGLDIKRVTKVVLSHGHYDHSGGLKDLCELTPAVQIFAHPEASRVRFSIKDPQHPKSIGMPEASREWFEKKGFTPTDTTTSITANLNASGSIPRCHEIEDTGGPFYLDESGTIPDPISDDQALWFVAAEGLVILLGCAHAGVVNTVEQIQLASGVDRVHALIGGFHLLNANEQRLDFTFQYLHEIKPRILAAGHCTGALVVERLRLEFSDAFVPSGAGSIFRFDL